MRFLPTPIRAMSRLSYLLSHWLIQHALVWLLSPVKYHVFIQLNLAPASQPPNYPQGGHPGPEEAAVVHRLARFAAAFRRAEAPEELHLEPKRRRCSEDYVQ